VVGEPVGVDPQVDLERGVGALQAEIVGDQQGEQTLVKAPLEAQVVDKVEVFTVDRESHRPLQHGVSPTPNRD
jgi:hypothetical protein